ncbi:MAG: DUF2523 domain-containing protein [Magnetococcales bacterium]|nr:DUF2523 domain-containing protein [Magnetococcales bacterium]
MSDFFQKIINFFDSIWLFITVDFWQIVTRWFDFQIVKIKTVSLEVADWSLNALWGLASPLFSSDTSALESIWSGLGSDVIIFMSVLKVPEALTILSTAWVTRFVIRLILPGIG